MEANIVTSILKRINHPALLDTLVNQLTGSELNSILLDVFTEKLRASTAPRLLKQYQDNRFVKPADLPVIEMRQVELDILRLFEQHSFEPVELSPVNILGSCSVLGSVSQKKVLSALRGTEVLADSTNALALHACDMKQRKLVKDDVSGMWMKCSAVQRQVRAQAINVKGFTPHFRIGCLVTCGTDTGDYNFEKQSIYDHLSVMKTVFNGYFKADDLNVRLLHREGYKSTDLLDEVEKYLRHRDPSLQVAIIRQPSHRTDYYKGLQFKVDIRVKDKTYEMADGGFVDWTQQLLENRKERMLASGFGLDLMQRIRAGMI